MTTVRENSLAATERAANAWYGGIWWATLAAGPDMTITALSDAELLAQARGGDEAAFTELYVRHQAAARRLAATYKRVGDPDDLVNGAFERVLGALRRGSGPTESFRAYLFVTLRRLAAEQGQRPADHPIDEVPEPVGEEAEAPELAQADRELIAQAYESLPDRWQAVLWHTAVEGRQPRELAAVLGVSANAASAMAHRAREKLRQAYLQAHLLASPAPEHEPYRAQLGAYVRDGLSARDRAAVQRHLDGCEECRDLVAELNDVNRMLVRSVVPLFLLGGAATKVAVAGVGAAAAGTEAAKSGSGGLLGKIKNAGPTVGGVVAAVAVVGGVIGLGLAVSRSSPGPTDQAADARNIGPSGAPKGGSGGSGSTGGGSGSGAGGGAGTTGSGSGANGLGDGANGLFGGSGSGQGDFTPSGSTTGGTDNSQSAPSGSTGT